MVGLLLLLIELFLINIYKDQITIYIRKLLVNQMCGFCLN